jgi:hypothetical protein
MLSGSHRWSARVQICRRHWVGDSSNSHLLGAVVGGLGRRDSRVGFKDIGADGFEVHEPRFWDAVLAPVGYRRHRDFANFGYFGSAPKRINDFV